LISIINQTLSWKQELSYFSFILLGGKSLKINLQKIKQKYYCEMNSIIGKVGLNTQPVVLVSLLQSCCVSILLYGAEALNWSKRMTASIENAYSLAFMKIFSTLNKKNCDNGPIIHGQTTHENGNRCATVKFVVQVCNS